MILKAKFAKFAAHTRTLAMELTDTHTHLYYLYGTPELAAQMQRCFDSGVKYCLLPNVDSESITKVLGTVAAYPDNCFAMMGLHPCDVKTDYRHELSLIEQVISENTLYGIGEIGIDLHWDKTTLPLQQDAFRIQSGWAKELNLPVSIHCRNAFDELFELLDEVQDGRLKGVLHCFTGNTEQAQRAIDLGLHLGIG
ncbi:MAG TPA: TatD family hydrolase, partial [Parapedobacter sp.]|nr:TatD family hydrolase [Parapedobacter sp.]